MSYLDYSTRIRQNEDPAPYEGKMRMTRIIIGVVLVALLILVVIQDETKGFKARTVKWLIVLLYALLFMAT
jgi:hypothetical protein